MEMGRTYSSRLSEVGLVMIGLRFLHIKVIPYISQLYYCPPAAFGPFHSLCFVRVSTFDLRLWEPGRTTISRFTMQEKYTSVQRVIETAFIHRSLRLESVSTVSVVLSVRLQVDAIRVPAFCCKI